MRKDCVLATNTGSEIVAFSRASHITGLANGNPLHEIDKMILFKIGKGKSCDRRKNLEILLANYETRITDYYIDRITRLDTPIMIYKHNFHVYSDKGLMNAYLRGISQL